MGSQITLIAVPFIALTMLHATALQVSLLAAVEMLPFLLFTLPAGAWLDRVRRRPVLVAADIGRGVVLLSVPIAFLTGSLSLAQLFVVAFVSGTFTAFFDVADQSYLPGLVDRDDLIEGNAKLQLGYSAAQIGGPTLGGNLLAVVAAPLAIAVDAVSFFASGGLVSAIRKREATPERAEGPDGRRPSIRSEVTSGLRFVMGDRYLRSIAGCTATSNLFGAALFGIFPALIWRELHLSTAFFGTVMGLASLGFVAGAVLSNRLPRTVGIGPTIVASAAVSSPAFLLVTLTPASPFWAACTLFVGWFVIGLTQVVYNVAQISLRQSITPPAMQSRMNATMRFLVWGTIPIGSVLGGLLTVVFPIRVALIIAAVGSFASVPWVAFSPLRRLRDMPKEPTAEVEARPTEVATGRPVEGATKPTAVAARSVEPSRGVSAVPDPIAGLPALAEG
jgi:MFS family permease